MKKIILNTFFILISAHVFSSNIHPNFNINNSDLEALLMNERISIRENILESPYTFLKYINELIVDNNIDLTLVDKENRLESDYIPENMINLSDYDLHTRYKTMMFSKVALQDFINMSADADDEGIELFIASTYRSYKFQNQIFNNMKNYHGEVKAATIVAYPGASQHQLGTGVDFGSIKPSFAYTDAGKWLLENSWKYGFTISYPQGMESITTYIWEPWHYRYIGHTAVKLQRNYFDDIQHLFLLFWNKYQGFFKERHIQ